MAGSVRAGSRRAVRMPGLLPTLLYTVGTATFAASAISATVTPAYPRARKSACALLRMASRVAAAELTRRVEVYFRVVVTDAVYSVHDR
jgi:hypothetical protein